MKKFFAALVLFAAAIPAVVFAGETETLFSVGAVYYVGLGDTESTQLATYGINAKSSMFFNSFPLGLYMNVSAFFGSGALMLTVGPMYQFAITDTLKVFAGIGLDIANPDRFYLSWNNIEFPYDTGLGIGACAAFHIRFQENFFGEIGANAGYSFSGYVPLNVRPFIALGYRANLQWYDGVEWKWGKK